MNDHEVEERLRAALGAKARAEVGDRRTPPPIDWPEETRHRRRWVAPLAIAASVALIGAAALASNHLRTPVTVATNTPPPVMVTVGPTPSGTTTTLPSTTAPPPTTTAPRARTTAPPAVITTTTRPPASTTTPPPPAKPKVPSNAALRRSGLCGAGCVLTGSLLVKHPHWGSVMLVTALDGGAAPVGHTGAFDSQGRLVWSDLGGHPSKTWALTTPATDKSGNIFIRYNPGDFEGIAVLQVAPAEFRFFAGAPGETDRTYWIGRVIGPRSSGYYDIEISQKTCDPPCGDGKFLSTVLHWNGQDYVP